MLRPTLLPERQAGFYSLGLVASPHFAARPFISPPTRLKKVLSFSRLEGFFVFSFFSTGQFKALLGKTAAMPVGVFGPVPLSVLSSG